MPSRFAVILLAGALSPAQASPSRDAVRLSGLEPAQMSSVFDGGRLAPSPAFVSEPANPARNPGLRLAPVLDRGNRKVMDDMGPLGVSAAWKEFGGFCRRGPVDALVVGLFAPIVSPIVGAYAGAYWGYIPHNSTLEAVLGGIGGGLVGLVLAPVNLVRGLVGAVVALF